MATLLDQLNEAMSTIAKSEVEKASSYDKTIVCKIIGTYEEKNKVDYYRVTNGTINFDAKVSKKDEQYSIGDKVYVMIPQGDYSLEKIIMGSLSEDIEPEEIEGLETTKIIEVEKININFTTESNEHISLGERSLIYPDNLPPTSWGIAIGLDTDLRDLKEYEDVPDYSLTFILEGEDTKPLSEVTLNLRDIQGNVRYLSNKFLNKVFAKADRIDLLNAAYISVTEKQHCDDIAPALSFQVIFGYDLEPYKDQKKLLVTSTNSNALIMEVADKDTDVILPVAIEIIDTVYYAGELVTWTRDENSNFRFTDEQGNVIEDSEVERKSAYMTLCVPAGTELNIGDEDILSVLVSKNGEVYSGQVRVWISYADSYNFQFDVVPQINKEALDEDFLDSIKGVWYDYDKAYYQYFSGTSIDGISYSNTKTDINKAKIPGGPKTTQIIDYNFSCPNTTRERINIGHKNFDTAFSRSYVQRYDTDIHYYDVDSSFVNSRLTDGVDVTNWVESASINLKTGEVSYEGELFNNYRIDFQKGDNYYWYEYYGSYYVYCLARYEEDASEEEGCWFYQRRTYTPRQLDKPIVYWQNGFNFQIGSEVNPKKKDLKISLISVSDDDLYDINKTVKEVFDTEKASEISSSYFVLSTNNFDISKNYLEFNLLLSPEYNLFAYQESGAVTLSNFYKNYEITEDGRFTGDKASVIEEAKYYIASGGKILLFVENATINGSDVEAVFRREIKVIGTKISKQETWELKGKPEDSYTRTLIKYIVIFGPSEAQNNITDNSYIQGWYEDIDSYQARKIEISIIEPPAEKPFTDTISSNAEEAWYNNLYFAQMSNWTQKVSEEETPVTFAIMSARPLQIDCGSYVGTGEYGKWRPNKITLPFVPQIIHFISNNFTYSWYNPQSSFIIKNATNQASLNENEFTWYCDKSASAQLNSKDTIVNWIALG